MFLCVRATEAEAAAALDAEVSAPADCAMVLIGLLEPDGSPVWKGAATDLGSAELSVKLKVVAFDSPGEYVIYRQETGHKTV
jgi:hypothetical protein